MTTVELLGITKRFGPFTALETVSFTAKSAQIQAIVGENGAGKTTLMRVLYGLYKADAGAVRIRGEDVNLKTPTDALAHGIGMVSQHYAIIPDLSCLENLMLGSEPGVVFSPKQAERRAQELAEKMGFAFNWSDPASTLGPAECQKLEILKLLWRNANIMVLDEPTAMLSPADADALYESLDELAKQGATIIVVTHRLPEVLEHCAEVTVLRGGKLIEARDVKGLTSSQLAEAIVGKALTEIAAPEAIETAGHLVISELSVRGARGDLALKHASLQVRKGEVVGIAGVDGNGQRELFQALLGVIPAESGAIQLGGVDLLPLSTRERIAHGVRLIAEDRHDEAVIEDWSLIENAILGFQRLETYRDGWRLDRSRTKGAALEMAERFNTKYSELTNPMGSLSGGNQQRFVAARAMAEEPSLVLAFQPTRGLDVEATRQVYGGLRTLCRENQKGALVVSFDLDELLEFCDRVVVLNHGVLSEPRARDRSEIGRLMVGASA